MEGGAGTDITPEEAMPQTAKAAEQDEIDLANLQPEQVATNAKAALGPDGLESGVTDILNEAEGDDENKDNTSGGRTIDFKAKMYIKSAALAIAGLVAVGGLSAGAAGIYRSYRADPTSSTKALKTMKAEIQGLVRSGTASQQKAARNALAKLEKVEKVAKSNPVASVVLFGSILLIIGGAAALSAKKNKGDPVEEKTANPDGSTTSGSTTSGPPAVPAKATGL